MREREREWEREGKIFSKNLRKGIERAEMKNMENIEIGNGESGIKERRPS